MEPSLAVADLKTNRLLKKITLPPGFKITLYAEDVPNARSMTLSPNGVLFVGTRKKGTVYAVIDNDQDQKADQVVTIASGLNMPNGVAFRDGHLYVAEVNRIIVCVSHQVPPPVLESFSGKIHLHFSGQPHACQLAF